MNMCFAGVTQTCAKGLCVQEVCSLSIILHTLDRNKQITLYGVHRGFQRCHSKGFPSFFNCINCLVFGSLCDVCQVAPQKSWSSPGGWGGKATNHFFPVTKDTVQAQLIRGLVRRRADYERLSPSSVHRKVSAFISSSKKCRRACIR